MRTPLLTGLALLVLAAPAAARPERPPVSWLKGEGNYTKASRHPASIDYVVVHVTEGRFWPSVRWLRDERSHASSHYVVGRRGRIVQLVHDSDIAWHAGNWTINERSIGIEHEGLVYGPNGFTEAQYRSSARLAAYLARRAVMPIDRGHFIGHDEVPHPSQPGVYGGSDGHTDPGPSWDWNRYLRLVRKYAYPPAPVKVSVRAPNLRDGKLVQGVFRWRARTDGPVRKVEVLIDGKVRLRDLRAPFGGLWETRRLKNGRHTVELRAFGPRGARDSVRFTVRVRNVPLVVRATVPGEVVGVVRIGPRVTGGKARRVLLYLDGERIDHDTSRPLGFAWNSQRVGNGPHVLELQVTARDGRTATKRLRVVVANPLIESQGIVDGVWTVATQGRVERVELLVDGELRTTLTAAPWSWRPELPPGPHTLTARAIGPGDVLAEATFSQG